MGRVAANPANRPPMGLAAGNPRQTSILPTYPTYPTCLRKTLSEMQGSLELAKVVGKVGEVGRRRFCQALKGASGRTLKGTQAATTVGHRNPPTPKRCGTPQLPPLGARHG